MRLSKRFILGAISVLISGGLLGHLLYRLDWRQAAAVARQADPAWLLLAVALSLMLPLCNVLRWSGVIRAQRIEGMPFSVALRAVLMANVLNSVLPSKAGDMAKAFYLRRHASLSVGLGAVVLERLIDLFMIGSLGIVGYLVSGAKWGLLGGALLVGGVCGAFVFILLLPVERLPLPGTVRRIAAEAREVFHKWIRHPGAVARTLTGSFLNWACGALSVCAMCAAFHAGVGWGYAWSIFPLAILAGLLPLTMSGVGTRDKAFVALLMAASVPRETATLIGVGYTVLSYWLLSLVSLPVVFWELRAYFAQRQTPQS